MMKRPAPPIAAINAARAHANIEAKCALIKGVLDATASGYQGYDLTPSDLPRSVRQFNLWAPEMVAAVGQKRIALTRNSGETLNNAPPELLDRVKTLIDATLNHGKESHPKQEKLSVLNRKLALSEKLRGIAERQIQKFISDHLDLSGEVLQLKAANKSIATKARSVQESLEQELQKMREEKSALLKLLAKTTKLR